MLDLEDGHASVPFVIEGAQYVCVLVLQRPLGPQLRDPGISHPRGPPLSRSALRGAAGPPWRSVPTRSSRPASGS
eukprot:14025244-Alexandrium_andersonii.AAC.1